MNIIGSRVTLSRRNLETLLKMLDKKVGMPVLNRLCANGVILYVKAEENEEHYNSEERQESIRGKMGVGPEDI